MTLDLFGDRAFKGMIRYRYRRDAEYFVWCLVYTCICVEKGRNGQIYTISPHPLKAWFENPDGCSRSKSQNRVGELLKWVSLHRRYKRLAMVLCRLWAERFRRQLGAKESADKRTWRTSLKVCRQISRSSPGGPFRTRNHTWNHRTVNPSGRHTSRSLVWALLFQSPRERSSWKWWHERQTGTTL